MSEETGLYNATAIHRAQLTLLAETMLGLMSAMIIPLFHINLSIGPAATSTGQTTHDHAFHIFPLFDTLDVSTAVTIIDLFDSSSQPL